MREGRVKVRGERDSGWVGRDRQCRTLYTLVKILDFILSEDFELKGDLNTLCFKSTG